jgi:hypothetical protein
MVEITQETSEFGSWVYKVEDVEFICWIQFVEYGHVTTCHGRRNKWEVISLYNYADYIGVVSIRS